MPLSVVCGSCGKRSVVPDGLVGKNTKCPSCRQMFMVSAVGAGGTIRVAGPRAAQKQAAVSIEWGKMLGIGLAVALVAAVAVLYFGPVRHYYQWEGMQAQAEDDVQDVVAKALTVNLADSGANLMKLQTPSVSKVMLFWHPMVMSMPEYVEFHGYSTEGEFHGMYDTQTHEVVSDVQLEETTFIGLKAVTRPGKKIHVTGRRDGTDVVVEVDGKPGVIDYSKQKAMQALENEK